MNAQRPLRIQRPGQIRAAEPPAKHELLLHDVYAMPEEPEIETAPETAGETDPWQAPWRSLDVNGPVCSFAVGQASGRASPEAAAR